MNNQHIIVFDGVCNFCNAAVNFIIKRDHSNKFLFAPMQSPFAQNLISEYGADKVGFDTFLLVKKNQCFFRSNAALEITKDLNGYWYLFRIFKILPRPIRDYFYRSFARNRYSIFGRTQECMVPTDELKSKFLWKVV
ncbi:thiol-disulfide oxidoreductase DCC family protein [Thalassotalea agarivorans]|uniref:Predicted thiol-disulfide oxidoreductase YuxK, DCC family n=1 Tax=Thalassotalea agarivorans TaxID=349064 RepID=A0A1I0G2B4_THASX|nr:thiol-disulfide oxidoreductase DCC family protein [Thalassotalea agarivorans]SET64737.1 Predicted thiol-disulfide oxidoreductase YuxK, DCC family [Thalassotalea agarivorans]